MIKKFLYYGVGAIGSALIMFLTIPFLTRILRPEDYGKGSMYIAMITLLFYICNLGLDMGYMRFFFKKDNDRWPSDLFLYCLSVVLVIAVFVTVVLFFLHSSLLEFVFTNSSFELLFSIVLGLFLYIINRFLMLSVRMRQKALIYSLSQIVNSGSYFGTMICLYKVYSYSTYNLMIYAQLAGYIFSIILLLFFCQDSFSALRFGNNNLQIKEKREVLKYSWPFVCSFVIVWGMQYVDRIILIDFSSYYQLGVYSSAFALAGPLIVFQGVFSTMWTPYGNKILLQYTYRARYIYSRLFKLLIAVMFLAMALIFLSKDVIILFLGSKYQGAMGVFMWLLFIPLYNLLGQLLNAGVIVSKKTIWNIIASLTGFSSNILFCIILIPKLHALGAAIGLFAGASSYFMVQIMSNHRYFRYDLSYRYFLFNTFIYMLAFILYNLGLFFISNCIVIGATLWVIYKWTRKRELKSIQFLYRSLAKIK